MPILSVVGRRSPWMRAAIVLLYVVLTAGAATMVYPFLLMLSTSVTSAVDVDQYQVVPAYFHDQDVLFAKYAEEKYVRAENLNAAYGCEIFEFRDLAPLVKERRLREAHRPAEARAAQLEDWSAFAAGLPLSYKSVCFLNTPQGMTGRAEALYRHFVEERFAGDLARCKERYEEDVTRFGALPIPYERLYARDYLPEPTAKYSDYFEFKQGLPGAYLSVVGVDWKYGLFLRQRYQGDLARLNADFGTSYASFLDLHLPFAPPPAGQPEYAAWSEFVCRRMPVAYVGVAGGAEGFKDFLRKAAPASRPAAERWERDAVPGFDRPRLLEMASVAPRFLDFVRAQPAARVRALSAENLFRENLRARYASLEKLNAAYATEFQTWREVPLPALEADARDLAASASETRWRYVKRNYAEVADYILLHGRALWNTAVLVVLTLLAHLTINPMAAYALSRFQLSYTSQLLLFCLATMAFPPEVAMIPSFLLLRSFPLARFVSGLAMGVLVFALWMLLARKRAPLWLGLPLGLAFGIGSALALPGAGSVSLLNTYWALVLPGLANGFSIFLLKGFFDTLPKELYEAAAMEGAGEFRMFFQITLPLCAPVLAVIALATFTAAYGSFMWAFLVCQQEEMWTLMVWLYEMQQWAPKYLLTAALAVAALPTLLVFILCQRLILRGIILPTLH